jgi:VanZ family protein
VRNDYYFGSPLVSIAWFTAVALVASGAVVAISLRRGAGRAVIVQRLEMTWLVASIGAAVILTLQPGPAGFGSALAPVLNPVSGVDEFDTVSNVVLCLPIGFFAALVWRSMARPVVWATGLAFSVSLSIELAQFVLPISRSAQTHDLILNTLGGLFGAVAGTVAARLVHRLDAPSSDD